MVVAVAVILAVCRLPVIQQYVWKPEVSMQMVWLQTYILTAAGTTPLARIFPDRNPSQIHVSCRVEQPIYHLTDLLPYEETSFDRQPYRQSFGTARLREEAALRKQTSDEIRSLEASFAAMPRTDDHEQVREFISDQIATTKKHSCGDSWSSR